MESVFSLKYSNIGPMVTVKGGPKPMIHLFWFIIWKPENLCKIEFPFQLTSYFVENFPDKCNDSFHFTINDANIVDAEKKRIEPQLFV